MRYLVVALAKGRLARKVVGLFEEIDISYDEIKGKDSRKLIFVNEELGIRSFLAKVSDMPTYVEYEAADTGIVGRDITLEEDYKLYEVVGLGTGKCRTCVCDPESARESLKYYELIQVATEYPDIVKDYSYNQKYRTVEIIKPGGPIELVPTVGLSEVIVDITKTGSTLRGNDLAVLEEMCSLSARVVMNQVSIKTKNEYITGIVKNFRVILKDSCTHKEGKAE